MQTENLLLFLAASAAIAVVPGSGMLYTVGRGVGQGRKAALVSVAGLNTGALVHAAFAALGISVLIQQSAAAFYAVKYAGAAYLVYLGIRILLDRRNLFGSPEGEERTASGKLAVVFAQGVATDLLNPQVYLFFVSFLPQFVDPSSGGVAGQMLLLGFLFVLVNLPIDATVAWFSGGVGDLLRRRPRFSKGMRLLSGGVMVGLGLKLALTEQR